MLLYMDRTLISPAFSDDDYRVLRQDLFKAFASASSPPTETPVVRSIEPGALGTPLSFFRFLVLIMTKGFRPYPEVTT